MPKVSVIIPAYNVEKYIAKTIQSVLDQTYPDFEVIVVNDESRDRTLEICQSISDSRLKVLSQPNRGPGGARNTGIRTAQGDYIAFLDGDDLWFPQKLEKHIAHLEMNPDVGISICRSAFINEAGEPLGIYQMPKLRNITPYTVICRNPVGNGSVPVIRKQVFEEIKYQDNLHGQVEDFYFDERFCGAEDIECWLRMVLVTQWKMAGIPEALTQYRVNMSGLSANIEHQREDLYKLFDKVKSYAPDAPIHQWENPAKAYYLRYSARRAVSQKDGKTAVKLFNQALTTFWGMLLEEPRRTVITGTAAYLLWALPESLYNRFESVALKATGDSQKRRMEMEQSLENSEAA